MSQRDAIAAPAAPMPAPRPAGHADTDAGLAAQFAPRETGAGSPPAAATTRGAAAPPHPAGCEHLDDAELVVQFEALAIAPQDFRHREHVRLAYAVLRGADFGEAAQRFRAALRRFATAAGVPGRYHETLTWAYLAEIARRLAEDPAPGGSSAGSPGGSPGGSIEFLARHPDLLDHETGAIARHYDVAAITASPLARAVFVLPER